ncbi:MAG: coagulation factor 5/8 type domain protein [Actinomycetia bacterium]|nr:coagulation factor 5/8 type domain protein [Actinomycetes bacterium]
MSHMPAPSRSPGRRASLRRLALVGAMALMTVGGAGAAAAATGGVGASLPYTELQAESAATNGTVIGPSYTYGQLADEASGRKAVTLSGTGQYVEFTLPSTANSIVFRYSIPDTASGSVYTAPIALYINGTKNRDFTLTNAYSWYYGGYPFTNSPGSNPHHFYDEVHALLPSMAAGTKVRLQVDTAGASSYTIDFADFEQVAAPIAQPGGSVSVTTYGADAGGVNDSTSAFNQAIAAAGAGGTVWIPQGTFKVTQHVIVNNVTVTGAGMWYANVSGNGVGFYGNYAPSPSSGVHLSNFAITGDVQERNDGAQVNGIGGALANSTVSDIWIEHTKVGAWMDGPFDGLTFTRMRIRDQTADGVNFHNGITHSTVTQSDLRNLGDDGLATWSETNADAFDTFSFNTVQYPILANGIAIYGGHDNTVSDNRVVDAGLTQGGGIHVAQRFNSTPLGLTTVTRNTLIRDGSLDPNWQFGVGALWFDARDAAMSGTVNVDQIVIQQSPYEAIQFVSGSSITNVNISNASIASVGTFVVQEQVGGSAKFTNVVATQVLGPAGQYNCGVGFTVIDGGGNSGWNTTYCGPWPTPPNPPPVGVSATPTGLSFGSQTTGTTSGAQAVTVTNSGSSAVSVSGVSITGDYGQTNTCGSSIGAGASCTVSVTFHPTANGTRTGTLTVSTSDPSGPTTVSLTGTGTAPGPALSASPASLAFASTVVGTTTAAQSTTLSNNGTSTATISSIAASGDFAQTNNCGTSLAVGASCTINVTFTPTAAGARTGSVTVTSNAVNTPTTISLSGSGIGTTTNVALNQPTSASSSVNNAQTPNLAVDGNASSYWESANGSFPQWLQVDLGSALSIGKVVLKLPPSTAWGARTQTLSVQGSTNGTTFTTLVNSASYTFDTVTGNTVTITFAASSQRYVRINITANTGWAAGQVSELEVYPAGGGGGTSATLSTNPSSLTFGSTTVGATSASQSVTVTNTGNAAASVTSIVASGDFAQTNTCGSSIAAGASCSITVTFTPTASGTRTGSVTITSSAVNSPTSISLSGTGAASNTNLALGKTMSASSSVNGAQTPNYANDNNTSSYWESANNTFPQWLQVDLAASTSVSRIVVTLPPSTSWATRTQTLSVLGSIDGTTFTTVVASAGYTFNPATGNTVTITFGATSQRYLRLNFTANTGWPAGQASEFQVYTS